MTDAPALLDSSQCVHCGFCLPACPTYSVLGTELDGPRGRLQLMEALESGALAADADVLRHLDLCLGCRACETECPSGVDYGHRLEQTRARLRDAPARPRGERRLEASLLALVAQPCWVQRAVFGALSLSARLGLHRWLPSRLCAAGELLARHKTSAAAPATRAAVPRADVPLAADPLATPGAPQDARAPVRVALLQGCIARVLFAHVNEATERLCTAVGATLVNAPGQRCCGALHAHAGELAGAQALARATIEAFERAGPLDAVIVNAAGCGSHLKAYGALLADDAAWAARAQAFSARVRDALEWLAERGPPTFLRAIPARVAYHDACHLAHGQRVVRQPRELLASVPGLRLLPLAQSDRCCGSAGLYNLLHPEVATLLRDEKLARLRESGADVVAAANPGCLLQLDSGARAAGLKLRVVHPLELLDEASRRVP